MKTTKKTDAKMPGAVTKETERTTTAKAKVKVGKATDGKKKVSAQAKLVSHTQKPADVSDMEWQTVLRRQVAEKEVFEIDNIGAEKVYSDYSVYSPVSKNRYKVAMRSRDNTLNFCSCPDFKTNLLGTCKHIEAVRLMLSKKRGIKGLLDVVPAIPYSSLFVSYYEERAVKLRIGTEQSQEFIKWSKGYFDQNNCLLPTAYNNIEQLLQEAQAISPLFRCYDDALSLIIEKRAETVRQELVAKKGNELLKGLSKVKLFPYQNEGVLFAANAGRCILADDMGLGKTLQAIVWAMLMQKDFGATKVVIVCPTSLKYQWKTEIGKFTESSVCVVEGGVAARREIYKNDESYFKVISYHVAGNDWQYINDMQPDIIILDEAQRIKNWRAKISQNIKRLRSPYTMVLTGTPVENNIEELYSLVQYVDQYQLGSLHHFLSAHQLKDETGKITGYKGLNEIGSKLQGMMLRRRKKEVLKQLPERMDKNLFVPLTEEQSALHTEYGDTVARLVNKWKRFGFLTEKERQSLLNCLNMMRMVCDSTYIIDQKTNFQTKLDELFNILEELFVDADEKVVIFSQWERMTRLIAAGLKERGIQFENLHGGIVSKDREALFTNFNNDPACKVFLSTDAGGVGLNLQSAATIINMDIPWNPAILEQRIGRIYRMGQKKNVSVINIVAQDSIEQRMLSVLKFKSAVAEGILDNGEDNIFAGEDKFKKFMQSVESMTVTDPADAVTTYDKDEQEEISAVAEELTDTGLYEEASEQPATVPVDASVATKPAELIQNGMSFLSQLMTTLSDPKATRELAESITERDEQTGQTYLKIPIENKDIVANALGLLGKLFGGK